MSRRLCHTLWCSLTLGWLALTAGAQAQQVESLQSAGLALSGYWFKAAAPDQKARPVVIGLHGCGGALDTRGQLNAMWPRYAGYFNAEQWHFVVLDSFTPRGLTSICATPDVRRTIHEDDRRRDVFAAIAWLARQPEIDATRIMVVGWSHGAQTVLHVLDASAAVVQAQKVSLKAAVAFYPGCTRSLRATDYAVGAPLLLMIGELDDWTLAGPCIRLHEKILKNQKDSVPPVIFEVQTYANSYHGFDGMAAVRTRSNIGNTRSGTATVGGNAVAREASHVRLFEFVAAQVNEPLKLSHQDRLKVGPVTPPLPTLLTSAD